MVGRSRTRGAVPEAQRPFPPSAVMSHHRGHLMNKIQPVIMCAGSGTRLWPESRESLPKQFIPLIGDRSTFQSIVALVGDRTIFEPPLVITYFDYRFRVAEQLKEIDAEGFVRVTAGRQRVAQHAHPQATFKPRGRATRPMWQSVSACRLGG